jgi:hypothetical protein
VSNDFFLLYKDRKESNAAIVENAKLTSAPMTTNTNPTAEVVTVATDDANAKDRVTGSDLNSKQDKPQVISSFNLRGSIDTRSTTSTFNVSHSTSSTPTLNNMMVVPS